MPALGDRHTFQALLLLAAPWVFVLLWSTGWIAARAAAPHADALTFLTVRFVAAGLCVAGLARIAGHVWPSTRAAIGHCLIAGALIHGGYLGAVWWAVGQGVPAGISGVIAAAQPIMTAAMGPWLINERLSRTQWLGIGTGAAGIMLVLAPKLVGVDASALAGLKFALVINFIGMLSVTLGTFYQKRFVPSGDLTTMTTLQYVGAAAVVAPLAYMFEPMRFVVNAASMATLAWSVIALSIGAVGLYLLLIRKGAVTRAAALIYLVPPTTALQSFVMFGETLTKLQMVGIAITVLGVALTLRRVSTATT